MPEATRPSSPFCEAMPNGVLCARPATHLSLFRPAWEYAHHCDEHANGDGWEASRLDRESSASRQHFIDTGSYLLEGEHIAQD